MIFGSFERLLALRYLRARRREGFVSVVAIFSLVGIFLGVGTLIVVMSVMSGFRHELLSQILGVNGHLSVLGISQPIADYQAVAKRIDAVPGVVSATPIVEGQVMATDDGRATGALVRGIRPEDLKARTLVSDSIRAGSLKNFHGEDAVAIGTRLAQRFGIAVGDGITLIAPEFTVTTIGSVPRIKTYRVVALFEVGMYEYDSSYIYMPLEAAQIFFRLKDQVNAVEVFVEDPTKVGLLRIAIRRAAGLEYRTLDWQDANSSFFNAVQTEKTVMFLILSLIIVVAAFNITSGQYMLVKGKGRDIAILRTMGATSGMVLRIFFLSGAMIGVLGTLLGVAGGVAFTLNIQTVQGWVEQLAGTAVFDPAVYFLSKLPARLNWEEVGQVVAMALAISFLAPLLPAWLAARLDPVVALRNE
ncbi:MAG: lipoprotein-releasing ABC transporter permease subunit [Rhodospirillales bacterium]|nr:lipoprotein-releasing ABC transporter permease subunit [Rhodospirillales bacterium]